MRKWLLIAVVVMVSLTACSGRTGTAQSFEDEIPVVKQESADTVSAEAIVEPARSVTLRAASSGQIVEVLVAEGDAVQADQILLRLDPTDAELAIQQAEAGLASAQAQLALAEAGARSEQIAVIEAQLEAATAALTQAMAQRDEQVAGLVEADIIEAQTQLAASASAHRQADEAHDKTLKCYDITFPDGTEETICPALGTYEELTRYQMEAAYAALVAAQAQLDALEGAVDPQADAAQAEVQAAVARRDAMQAQLDLAQAGSRAEEIALAEAGVQQAEAALTQARALLDLSVLEAPFGGTVTDLPVNAGNTAAPGEALVTLATLDRLQIKTTDLTELNVVRVAVAQPVTVTLEAMPDQPLAGHVVRVDRQGVNYLGDVTYPVTIELDDLPPGWLRWGMTAQVEIEAR